MSSAPFLLLTREEDRLKTFDNWSCDFVDKNVLARTGMYYTNENDVVRCQFCKILIGSWEEDDDPITEHIRWSTNCPLIRRKETSNIAIDEKLLEETLALVSYDVCGGGYEIRPYAYLEPCITQPSQINDVDARSAKDRATHKHFLSYSERYNSFRKWPNSARMRDIHALVRAGFFYCGNGDRVICFFCGTSLSNMPATINILHEHKFSNTNCIVVKFHEQRKQQAEEDLQFWNLKISS